METTTLPVERAAESAGRGTAAALRHQLRIGLGVSPLAYQNTVRAS